MHTVCVDEVVGSIHTHSVCGWGGGLYSYTQCVWMRWWALFIHTVCVDEVVGSIHTHSVCG